LLASSNPDQNLVQEHVWKVVSELMELHLNPVLAKFSFSILFRIPFTDNETFFDEKKLRFFQTLLAHLL